MSKNTKKHIASLVTLIVFSILAVGSTESEEDTKEVQSKAPSYTLSANQLYREYENNEVSADAKYKGKIVIVSGKIQDVGKDIMDEPYIVIGGEGFLDGVQCSFAKSQESSIARLSKGQNVKVKGEVSGKMGNVQIENSSLQ